MTEQENLEDKIFRMDSMLSGKVIAKLSTYRALLLSNKEKAKHDIMFHSGSVFEPYFKEDLQKIETEIEELDEIFKNYSDLK